MDVHLEVGFVGQNAGLPVLLKMLWGDHAHRLNLHGLKAEGDDVVHAFNDCTAFAGERNARRSEFHWHSFPSPETQPRDTP